jgi:methionyl-tRNA formyltransferase
MSKSIRVVIAGKNKIAIDIVTFMLKNVISKSELGVLFNSTDKGIDSWQPSFRAYAIRNSLREFTLTEAQNLSDILFLSLEFDKILKPENFTSDNLVNIHFSNLPKYKGMYTSIYPILNDEDYAGVTLHRIDKGIDTGDIIDSSNFSIDDKITSEQLYSKYLQAGTELVIKNIDNLVNYTYSSHPQKSAQSSYYSRSSIDWDNIKLPTRKTAFEIHNYIRAFAFRPYQLPEFQGNKIMSSLVLDKKSVSTPGTIEFEGEHFLEISTIDYDLRLCFDITSKLIECAESNDLVQLKRFKSKGFRLDGRTTEGWSVAIVAAYNYRKETLNWLLSEGWNVNDQNFNGTTLSMYVMLASAKNDDIEWFVSFLSLGPDLKMKDYRGLDILDYAIKYHFNDHLIILKNI